VPCGHVQCYRLYSSLDTPIDPFRQERHYMSLNYKKAELLQRWPRDAPICTAKNNGCPEIQNFRESPSTPTVTFKKFLAAFCSDRMCVQNLTCVPQIIGVLQKIGQYLDTPTLHFLQKILMGLCADGHCEGTSHLKSVALPVPEIIAIEVLDEWELRTPVIPSVNSRPSLFSGRSLYLLEHFARWHSVCAISFCLP